MKFDGTCSNTLRLCPYCKFEKPADDFHKKGDRREHICKLCSNIRKKKIRDEKKRKERRKRGKNHTLVLATCEVVGHLSSQAIEDFGRVYGNLMQEVLSETNG